MRISRDTHHVAMAMMEAGRLDRTELARMVDHTLLKPDATHADLTASCAVARRHAVGAMCVRPIDVSQAAQILADTEVRVITVIGFPMGYAVARAKAFEAEAAIADGARELDMVINIVALKSGDHAAVQEDIAGVVNVDPSVPVKVIIETCYLSDEQKVSACKLAVDGGAQFVKTSTGFGPAGATEADVRLLRRTVGPDFGVKASGGIRTAVQAMAMIEAGADRLGVSATDAIMAGWGA